MGIAGTRPTGIDVRIPRRCSRLTVCSNAPGAPFSALARELFIVHRMLCSSNHITASLRKLVVRHKKIAAVTNKNAGRIEKPIRLQTCCTGPLNHSLHWGRSPLDKFAQSPGRREWRAGNCFVIETLALQEDLPGFGSKCLEAISGGSALKQAPARTTR